MGRVVGSRSLAIAAAAAAGAIAAGAFAGCVPTEGGRIAGRPESVPVSAPLPGSPPWPAGASVPSPAGGSPPGEWTGPRDDGNGPGVGVGPDSGVGPGGTTVRVVPDPSGLVPPGWSVRAVGGTTRVYLPADARRGVLENPTDPDQSVTTLTAVTDEATYAVAWERYPAGTPDPRGAAADALLAAILDSYLDAPGVALSEVERRDVIALGLAAADVTAVEQDSGLDLYVRVVLLPDGAVVLTAVADGRAAAARAIDELYDTMDVS